MIQKDERVDASPYITYTVESMNIDSITQVDDNVTKRKTCAWKTHHNENIILLMNTKIF